QERGFVRGFEQIGLANGPIVMFVDIRLWGMLSFWQEIERPKLDLTSFGHWSGTGPAGATRGAPPPAPPPPPRAGPAGPPSPTTREPHAASRPTRDSARSRRASERRNP